jgi:capsular exopolysaccharide synthesis family protein
MGKIHQALQKAEHERARSVGVEALEPTLERSAPVPGRPLRSRVRGRKLIDARRSRIVLSESESSVAKQYGSLRARIQSLRRSRELRSIVVTSAVPREGKTTTAMNLALSYGLDVEHTTCLVDADLRTPSVHRALPEVPEAGLGEVLDGHCELDAALIEVPDTSLSALPVRSLPTHPSELLGSGRMVELLQQLHERFDTVIIDTPPVLALPDATTLVDACDATILVVGSGISSRDDVEGALERIDRSKLLGTVLNYAEDVPKAYGYYYGGSAR